MKNHLIKNVKKELENFLEKEWNEEKAKYFETNLYSQILLSYLVKYHNSPRDREKYHILAESLSKNEEKELMDYAILKETKDSLEFIRKNYDNPKALENFKKNKK